MFEVKVLPFFLLSGYVFSFLFLAYKFNINLFCGLARTLREMMRMEMGMGLFVNAQNLVMGIKMGKGMGDGDDGKNER